MSRSGAIRDAWHPQTKEERDLVLQELHEVLASPHFCNSKRYPALLQYIVRTTLDGRSELLKERTLGVEVFDRPPSYDTNTDTVVRYTAGEVRKRLSLYYHELDRKPAVQISLPPGSYVPEFLHASEDQLDAAAPTSPSAHPHEPPTAASSVATWMAPADSLTTIPSWPDTDASHIPAELQRHVGRAGSENAIPRGRRWILGVGLLAAAVLAVGGWRYHSGPSHTAVDEFWAPLLHNQKTVLLCTGGVVFDQKTFSGVITAGKDVEYPFVSFQNAAAIARVSGIVERGGATTQLQSSATTPLTELRDQPVVLIGGYNNLWTMRMLTSLPYHFAPEPDQAIVDSSQPQVRWARDRSLPYSGADDYAVIARFHDAKTDEWIVAVAGLGRNGTEAAAEFVTTPHYMQSLRDQLGSDFGSKNLELILKINVIEGKTGAPVVLARRSW